MRHPFRVSRGVRNRRRTAQIDAGENEAVESNAAYDRLEVLETRFDAPLADVAIRETPSTQIVENDLPAEVGQAVGPASVPRNGAVVPRVTRVRREHDR